jgi:hypothetical protein
VLLNLPVPYHICTLSLARLEFQGTLLRPTALRSIIIFTADEFLATITSVMAPRAYEASAIPQAMIAALTAHQSLHDPQPTLESLHYDIFLASFPQACKTLQSTLTLPTHSQPLRDMPLEETLRLQAEITAYLSAPPRLRAQFCSLQMSAVLL